ncbi:MULTISPECIES: hypothetical protein [unclassified Janthinobacterium]|uniref:hypothetical protein n=1 Tax=unclassified Janthinobacterium TaxID=2610881 RepID=UPI000AE73A90|nr:hypothetical protein [Janthinobacterium sp. CG_23.4]MCL6484876.1 hypothetical protein [Janthinobacterium lividum]MDH6158607.1 hypothetical protein [Janthinobacterium sp. CG_23.4]
MDKALLTSLKATARAAFNKLLNQTAKIKPIKISYLENQTISPQNYFANFAKP